MKTTYTREEKIAHYAKKLELAKKRLEVAKRWVEIFETRLQHISSEKYQEWDGKLQEQLEEKKAGA